MKLARQPAASKNTRQALLAADKDRATAISTALVIFALAAAASSPGTLAAGQASALSTAARPPAAASTFTQCEPCDDAAQHGHCRTTRLATASQFRPENKTRGLTLARVDPLVIKCPLRLIQAAHGLANPVDGLLDVLQRVGI